MAKIEAARGRIIEDSRGEKTIEIDLLSRGREFKSSVPSGKSRGKFEAKPIAPEKALESLERVMRAAGKKDFATQREFDDFLLNLDGTPDKSNLGANLTLALSISFARLLANNENLPLYEFLRRQSAGASSSFPRLLFNLINGGLHVSVSDTPLPFQEYLVVPKTNSPEEALKTGFEFIETLKGVLAPRGEADRFGDEGGFVVSGLDPELGLELLDDARRVYGDRVDLSIDAAASSLWDARENIYKWRSQTWTGEELLKIYEWIIKRYSLLSIEDPFDEERMEEWQKLSRERGGVWIIGDDLTVTNVERIKKAAQAQAASGVIIKPNQIGTVSETISAVNLARQFDWKVVVSHRSGETDDDFIADLAYGIGADGLKSGSPLQSERLVKYKRLVQIEKSLRQEINKQ